MIQQQTVLTYSGSVGYAVHVKTNFTTERHCDIPIIRCAQSVPRERKALEGSIVHTWGFAHCAMRSAAPGAQRFITRSVWRNQLGCMCATLPPENLSSEPCGEPGYIFEVEYPHARRKRLGCSTGIPSVLHPEPGHRRQPMTHLDQLGVSVVVTWLHVYEVACLVTRVDLLHVVKHIGV